MSTDALKLPPNSIEAERNVLVAAIYEPRVLPELVAILRTPDAFYRESHQAIWGAILELFADGATVDAVHVFERLEHAGRGDLADAANSNGLGGILTDQPIVCDAAGSAVIVRDKAMLRSLMETANSILRDGYSNSGTAEQAWADAMTRLNGIAVDHELSSTTTVADLLPEIRARIETRQCGEVSGLLSGFAELDSVTDGFQPQDLVVIGARPSMGKTAFALNICDHLSVNMRTPTLFVSLEMNSFALTERVLISRAGVDGHKIKTGDRLSRDEWARLEKAQAAIRRGAAIHIVERPSRSYAQICGEIRAAVARHKIKLAVVDYAQLIGGDNPRDTETQAITIVSRAMKAIARELNIVVVLLSQLNRGVESRDDRVPRMSDFRSSGSLEQDADIALLLYRPEYYDPDDRPGEAEVIIGKNRNGRVGSFNLWFRNAYMKFEDHVPMLEGAHMTNGHAAY